jgi:hypothetical protein
MMTVTMTMMDALPLVRIALVRDEWRWSGKQEQAFSDDKLFVASKDASRSAGFCLKIYFV